MKRIKKGTGESSGCFSGPVLADRLSDSVHLVLSYYALWAHVRLYTILLHYMTDKLHDTTSSWGGKFALFTSSLVVMGPKRFAQVFPVRIFQHWINFNYEIIGVVDQFISRRVVPFITLIVAG